MENTIDWAGFHEEWPKMQLAMAPVAAQMHPAQWEEFVEVLARLAGWCSYLEQVAALSWMISDWQKEVMSDPARRMDPELKTTVQLIGYAIPTLSDLLSDAPRESIDPLAFTYATSVLDQMQAWSRGDKAEAERIGLDYDRMVRETPL